MVEWILFSTTLLVTIFFLKVVTLPKNYFQLHFKTFFFVGLLLRIICIFLSPVWEDDWARYIWEGNLIRNSVSPYEIAPIHFFSDNSLDTKSIELLSKINHPKWTTIYSPFILLYFALFSYGFSAILLKCSYLVIEILTFLHWRYRENKFPIILYWVYPVLIKEVYLNFHFEVIIVALFWIFFYTLKVKQFNRSGIIFGLLIHTKLITFIYGILLFPFLYFQNQKKHHYLSFILSFTIGLFLFYFIYLIIFPNTSDFGIINLQRFGGSFTFNQFYEPIWNYFFSNNPRSFPFFFQFLLLFTYLYLLLPKKNRTKRFLVICKNQHFPFYFGYFTLTMLPVYNPWYFLTLVPLITISRSLSILPWILISILQLSYLTNVRLHIPFQYFYEIPNPILLSEAFISIICIFLYFRQIFILLYKISNISNIGSKG